MNWIPQISAAVGLIVGFAVSWGSVKKTIAVFSKELDGMRHFGEDLAVLKVSILALAKDLDGFSDSIKEITGRIRELELRAETKRPRKRTA